MKKALIFLAEGYEEVEAMTPVDLLRRAGVEVIIVSADNKSAVKGAHSIEIGADKGIDDVDVTAVDLVILPGGMPGTKNLDKNEKVIAAVNTANDAGKYIGAICAAPSVLGHMGLLEGKKATCYPGFENELTGADFVEEEVVADGNIITSRGVGTAIAFSLKLIEVLTDAGKAQEIAKSIIYKK